MLFHRGNGGGAYSRGVSSGWSVWVCQSVFFPTGRSTLKLTDPPFILLIFGLPNTTIARPTLAVHSAPEHFSWEEPGLPTEYPQLVPAQPQTIARPSSAPDQTDATPAVVPFRNPPRSTDQPGPAELQDHSQTDPDQPQTWLSPGSCPPCFCLDRCYSKGWRGGRTRAEFHRSGRVGFEPVLGFGAQGSVHVDPKLATLTPKPPTPPRVEGRTCS